MHNRVREAAPCYVSEDKTGKWVFVANYCSGSLAALPVNSDGSLAPAMQVIQQFGKGPDTARQEAAHVHSAIFSPDERFLLEANLGTDQEHVYIFHPNEMIPLAEPFDSVATLQPGSGPRHIAFHPKKSNVYILSELSGTVDAFHFDSTSGKMNHFQRIRTTPEHFKGFAGSADIHIRPMESFCMRPTGEHRTPSLFSKYRKMAGWPQKKLFLLRENIPAILSLIPVDIFCWLPIATRIILSFFSIDPASGLLKATGKEISIPNPVCLKFLGN
ncbi:MAG: beta-propeller fold lactonase family protein [Puia sp.]